MFRCDSVTYEGTVEMLTLYIADACASGRPGTATVYHAWCPRIGQYLLT